MTENARPRQCPECGSEKIAEIIYGLVASDLEIEKQVKMGRIVLAGCDVPRKPMRWKCLNCKAEWGKVELQETD